ncbi:MAG: hypothetical protein ACTSRP_00055 [Candidatus Helarchaeota archaeon]
MKILDLIHITAEDIKSLNEYESTNLFDRLFRYEFKVNSLEISGLTLSSNPKIKDQGIDAIITKPLPTGLDFLPPRISIYQFKASESTFNVKNEFCQISKETNKLQLKPLMQEYLEEKKATYVLINTKKVMTFAQKEALKKKILRELREINEELDFPIIIYTADDVARWCDKYPIFRLDFNKLEYAKSFDDWKEEIQNNKITDTLITDTLKSLMWELFNKINSSKENIKIFRIIGVQGIGKKTFLYESLEKLPMNKKSNIIILDAKINKIDTISKALYYFSITSGILVILNCSDKYHNEICERLTTSKLIDFVLITLNSQSYIEESRIFKKTEIIKISNWEEKDIEKLIKQIKPDIPYHISYQIVKYSQGIPDFIISIYQMLKNEDFKIYKLDNIKSFCESIISFLIRESGFDRAILTRILVGFSLFSYLGWEAANFKEMTSEGTFEYKFKENKKIFAWIIELENQMYQIEQIVNYLLRVKILRMRGRFIYITPRPLAIHLLQNYTEESKIIEYFEKISNINDKHFLKRFLERLEDFAFEDIGKKIVNAILHSPLFDDWRKINNREISGILLKLSIINNKLVAKKLTELFKDTNYDTLKKELTSRRDLINSLEYIIWYDNTFEVGMNILLKLAIAENETCANNATGNFCNKFSIYLPGTSVTLQDRMTYLEKLNESSDENEIFQVINALQTVFNLEQHSRIIFAELQALKPIPKEYHPESKAEIKEYLKRGFKILEKNLESKNIKIQKISYKILLNNFMIFFDLGLWEKIKEYWIKYMKMEQNYKFEILNFIEREIHIEHLKFQNLKKQIKQGLEDKDYEVSIKDKFAVEMIKSIRKDIEEKKEELGQSKLKVIYNKLIDEKLKAYQRDFSKLEEFQEEIKQSFTLLDQIKWILMNIDNWYEEGLNYDQYLRNQAKEIAIKLQNNPSKIKDALSLLITNGRYIVYFVGEEYANLDPNYDKWELIKQIFLNNKENRKPEFIIGYLSKYRLNNPNKYNELIDEIKKEEGLSKDLFEFAYRKDLDKWSIDLIIELYHNKIINDLDLRKFANPHRVETLEGTLYIQFIKFYFKNVKNPLNVPRGSWGDHLYILNNYLKEHKEIIPEIKDLLIDIATSFEYFESEEIIKGNSPLSIPRHINLSPLWRELVFLIIGECPEALELIRKKILDHLPKLPILVSQPEVQKLFIKFLEIEKEKTWEAFEDKFINDPDIRNLFQFYFNLEFLLEVPEERIITLCKKDPDVFPSIIAEMIDGGIIKFEMPPNLIVRLVEEFYENEKFRNNLIRSFNKGIKLFLPGRSAEVFHSYIEILKKWKNKITSKKFLDWIDDAIEYFNNEFTRAMMRDKEEFESIEEVVNPDEFYEKENWINSIKEDYIGEIIAFTNIKGEWRLLAHSSDEDSLFEILKELYSKGRIDKKYKVRFRKF